jgi:hypothetical protein
MADRHSWAKTQHYVPQFLLKNFAEPEKDQIHVFDKQEERTFRAHVRKVAAETGLYDIKSLPSHRNLKKTVGNLQKTCHTAGE